MVFRRRTAGRKTGGKRKFARRVAPKRRVGARKSMVKLIKSVIHRQAENKVVEYSPVGAQPLYNSSVTAAWNAANVIPLTPYTSYMNIVQGTGQGDRIGNRISTRKVFIKFVMYPAAYDVTLNPLPAPQDVRIMIVKWKDTPTKLIDDTTYGNLFQNGDSATGPIGNLTDTIRDINKDKYTVCYDKVVKVGNAISSASGPFSGAEYYANNDYKLNVIRKIDVTKWCPKQILFNDNTSLPETPVLQMVIFPISADGSINSFKPIYWFYQTHYEYEDM